MPGSPASPRATAGPDAILGAAPALRARPRRAWLPAPRTAPGGVSRHSLLEAMASDFLGAFDQVLDLHFALGLLVAALDDDAGRAALVGVFQLRAHLAGAEIKLGVDARVAQRLHHALIVGDAVLIEHGDDHGAGRGFGIELAEMLERGHAAATRRWRIRSPAPPRRESARRAHHSVRRRRPSRSARVARPLGLETSARPRRRGRCNIRGRGRRRGQYGCDRRRSRQ